MANNINKCPHCSSHMIKKLAPFYYHGTYIGLFKAYVCDFCKRKYFTEKAYKDIMATPTSLDDFLPFIEVNDNMPQPNKTPHLIEIISMSDSNKNDLITSEDSQNSITS